jgi:hypothetical protein
MCVKVKNMLKIYSPLQDNKNCVNHLVSKIHFIFLKTQDEMKNICHQHNIAHFFFYNPFSCLTQQENMAYFTKNINLKKNQYVIFIDLTN